MGSHGPVVVAFCDECGRRGRTKLLPGQEVHDRHPWICDDCRPKVNVVRHGLVEVVGGLQFRMLVGQDGKRRCGRCRKPLARRNDGPICFSCDDDLQRLHREAVDDVGSQGPTAVRRYMEKAQNWAQVAVA